MNSVDVYVTYLLMRNHVTKEKTIFNKHAAPLMRGADARLLKDRFKHKYVDISRQLDPYSYLVGNFIYTGGFIAEFKDKNYWHYQNFQKHVKPFKDQLKLLEHSINYLAVSKDDGNPPLIKMLLAGTIDLMTVIILDRLLGMSARWKQQAFCDDKVTKKLVHRLEKLGMLIEIENDFHKYREITLEHFERFKHLTD